jgi:hypothetical protein
MGLVIEAYGGSADLTNKREIYLAYASQDLFNYCTDGAHGTDGSTLILNDGSTDDIPEELVDEVLAGGGGEKTVFAPINLSNATVGDYNTSSIPKNSTGNLTFNVPEDFLFLVSLEMIGIPEASETNADINCTSTYANVNEPYNQHQGSDEIDNGADKTGTLRFDLVANELNAMDIATVFPELAAGDKCGLFISHNSINGKIDYLGVKLVYR